MMTEIDAKKIQKKINSLEKENDQLRKELNAIKDVLSNLKKRSNVCLGYSYFKSI